MLTFDPHFSTDQTLCSYTHIGIRRVLHRVGYIIAVVVACIAVPLLPEENSGVLDEWNNDKFKGLGPEFSTGILKIGAGVEIKPHGSA